VLIETTVTFCGHFTTMWLTRALVVWCSGSALVSINEVILHWVRLEWGWVTVFGLNFCCGIFILVCDQPPRSTQPGHPFVGRCNEYQPKGGAALRLGSKGRYGSYVGGSKTV